MKSRTPWLFCGIVFLASFVLPSSPPAAVAAKKVRLAYSAFAYANPPFWIAQDLKLFEKYGLDTELVYVSGTRPIQAMLGDPSTCLKSAERPPYRQPPRERMWLSWARSFRGL